MISLAEPVRAFPQASGLGARAKLTIGLVNNMPDAALAATEEQHRDLIEAAAGATEVELRLFALPGVARGERAKAAMAGRYESATALADTPLDGLIVTGAEPRADDLTAEPFWPALTRVVDWTRETRTPVIWSCLAAHAAVLHLDGIRRRPLITKLSGVFESQVLDDALQIGPAPVLTPHSRQNGLWADELAGRGYEILTHSVEAGVDAFVKSGPALALFLHGHPEYEADTLLREYLRDVSRFLRGERPAHPATPSGYFDAPTAEKLATLAREAHKKPDPRLGPHYVAALSDASPSRTWRGSAVRLYRAWLTAALGRVPAESRWGFGQSAN